MILQTLTNLAIPKLTVFICTFAQESSVKRIVVDFKERFHDLVHDVKYADLTNGPDRVVKDLKFELDWSPHCPVAILCHSLNNRRYVITNGQDAQQYGGFLPKTAEILGELNKT